MSVFDLRHALRNLLRTPGFTTVAVLMLALGIGANTAIFSIVNGIVIQPLAYKDPGRLVSIQEIVEQFKQLYPTVPVNARHFDEWRKKSSTLENVSLLQPAEMNLTGAGAPERLKAARVSASFLPTLGVQPAIGRNFLDEEDQFGRSDVVLLSDGLWRRRFGADPAVVGRTITLDGKPYLVAGVLPASFRYPALNRYLTTREVIVPDLLVPMGLNLSGIGPFGEFNYACIGRLKTGVSLESARADLDRLTANIIATMKENRYKTSVSITPLADEVVGKSRDALVLVLAAVGVVLLIVCVNLANLSLARTAARRREAAVRTALGAGRARLLGQALGESIVLAAAGGVLGVATAYAGMGALLRSAPVNLPRLDEVALDGTVLLFAFGVTALTAVLAGVIPAWRLSAADPQEALRAGGRSMTEGSHGARLRNVLVGLEVGLSTVLVITAGLLAASFARLMQVDKGFRPERVMAAQVGLPEITYRDQKDWTAFIDRVLPRIKAIPGVTDAAVVYALPLSGEGWVNSFTKRGDTRPAFERPMINMRFASASYFATMGIPIVKGRAFEERDRGRKVIVMSARAAEALWPGEDPIGKMTGRFEPDTQVIGVAGDVRADIDKDPPRMVYLPYWDNCRSSFNIVVRTAMDPRAAAGAVRRAVWAEDAGIPVPEMTTMTAVVSKAAAQRRFQMWLVTVFAAAALALACLGIYGVIANAVARRTNEMGVRMAMGATGFDLVVMVLKQGLAPVAAGLGAGVVAALALARVLRSALFQVSATDPRIISGAVLALGLVAVAACLLPARRASRVDPITALRYE